MSFNRSSDIRPNIAIVVAHPDDLAFGMGGTALLLKDTYKLHVICASRGERGYAWKGEGLPPPDEKLAVTREKEEQAACDLLDASLTFLDLPDSEIYAEKEAVDRVAKMLEKIQPTALFTLGPQEKPDHAAVYLIAYQALHRADLFWTTEMYMMLRHGETRHGRYANIYVNISSVRDQKIALVRCHKTQNPNEAAVAHMEERSSLLGKLALCDHAEAFMPSLNLIGKRWDRPAGCILMDLH